MDTIVAKVQGVPGDDRCVLLLGYAEQMETMMREGNPGLARRFQLSEVRHRTRQQEVAEHACGAACR